MCIQSYFVISQTNQLESIDEKNSNIIVKRKKKKLYSVCFCIINILFGLKTNKGIKKCTEKGDATQAQTNLLANFTSVIWLFKHFTSFFFFFVSLWSSFYVTRSVFCGCMWVYIKNPMKFIIFSPLKTESMSR